MPFSEALAGKGTKDISKIDAICDFLEVYIHSVLYARGVYPRSLFEDRYALGVAVKASRHPELNQYIADAVAAVKAELSQNNAPSDVMIEIIDGQQSAIESFLVELSSVGGMYESSHDLDLRAALIRLCTLEPSEKPLKDATFQVCFRRRGDGAPSLEKNAWIPRLSESCTAQVSSPGGMEDAHDKDPRLVCLGAVDSAELKVQMLALLRRI